MGIMAKKMETTVMGYKKPLRRRNLNCYNFVMSGGNSYRKGE